MRERRRRHARNLFQGRLEFNLLFVRSRQLVSTETGNSISDKGLNFKKQNKAEAGDNDVTL